jgi:hypothetical protein
MDAREIQASGFHKMPFLSTDATCNKRCLRPQAPHFVGCQLLGFRCGVQQMPGVAVIGLLGESNVDRTSIR